MNTTNFEFSLSKNDDSLLQFRKLQQLEGEKFLRFSLTNDVNGLIPLSDLQGTIEVQIKEILPIPEVSEYWLGLVNWQGEATWILDLSSLLGASHWFEGDSFYNSGFVMLIQVEKQTIGLLVKEVKGIESYDRTLCFPISDVISFEELSSFLGGYFVDSQNSPLMLLDIQKLIDTLAN